MLRTYPLDFYFDHSPEEIWPIMIDRSRLMRPPDSRDTA